MHTAPVKPIALPAVYRANLELQSHVPFQHSRTRVYIRVCFQGFAHARTPRVLHFSAFITLVLYIICIVHCHIPLLPVPNVPPPPPPEFLQLLILPAQGHMSID